MQEQAQPYSRFVRPVQNYPTPEREQDPVDVVISALSADTRKKLLADRTLYTVFRNSVTGLIESKQTTLEELVMMDETCIKRDGTVNKEKLYRILGDKNGSTDNIWENT